MSTPPDNLKIYHITHVDNLQLIVQAGYLWSDRRRLEKQIDCSLIGMPTIKDRRLNRINVSCNPGTKVGDYVPFYLCPRSIMLYIFYKKNHPDLPYRGGQEPILHLQADLRACTEWAAQNNGPIAFSTSNAGSYTADFFNRYTDLDQIDWNAVNAHDFRDREVQERKQAEFLVHDLFPWSLVEHIGVFDQKRLALASEALALGSHRPSTRVENGWYF